MPLVGGMVGFVLAIVVLLLWLIFGGSTGKQRGLVVINLRTNDSILTLEHGQSAHFKPGESQTLFAIKSDFPQAMIVTDATGTRVFEERIDYQQLVDAEFRIAIDDHRVVFPLKPPGS